MRCKVCGNKIAEGIEVCAYCGANVSSSPRTSEKKENEAQPIIIQPENVHISKQRRDSGFSMFGDIFGGGFTVRTSSRGGGGIFDSLFGDFFGGFYEEEEEEYCDFTPADQKFLNPKLKIIDPKKMIVLEPEDFLGKGDGE